MVFPAVRAWKMVVVWKVQKAFAVEQAAMQHQDRDALEVEATLDFEVCAPALLYECLQ